MSAGSSVRQRFGPAIGSAWHLSGASFGWLVSVCVSAALISGTAPLLAQCNGTVHCNQSMSVVENGNGTATPPNWCSFPVGKKCELPVLQSLTYLKVNPLCDPTNPSTPCAMTATAGFEFPGNRLNVCTSSATNAGAEYRVNGVYQGDCGLSPETINTDRALFTVSASILCTDSTTRLIRAASCPSMGSPFSCELSTIVSLDFARSPASGCPVPLPDTCTNTAGNTSGAGGMSCPLCQQIGGDAACSVGDGKASCAPSWAGNAQLRYAAAGVGGDGLPGAVPWRTTLGRFWSHDYAERIVVFPDSTHVFLLTRFGSFREFSSLGTIDGNGLRFYQTRAPSDEFRQLAFVPASSTWQLRSLDGRTDYFRSDGLWDKAVLAQDPSHPIQGHYNGLTQLDSVSFPDGRSDNFTYSSGGKLKEIIGIPVPGSGAPARTWTLAWDGSDQLDHIDRPDGTRWQFYYNATRPGYLDRVDLVSTAGLRIMAAFSYLTGTNLVEKSWRGDPDFDNANAADQISYTYTNPTQPTRIVTTRKVTSTLDQQTTLDLGRDTASNKPRVEKVEGACGSCGLSPSTTFAYTGTNPLLPSSTTDGKLTRTDFTYDGNGRLSGKTEAANVPSFPPRLTSYSHGETSFPGLVTRIEVPSTLAGCNGNGKRRTDFNYDDVTGVLLTRTIEGCEGGSPLPVDTKVTVYTPNSSGETTSIDPPGFSTNDVSTFVYDLPNRNGHVVHTRTDPNPPNAGALTTFGYDGFNRRTSVTDANGVEARTSYDALDRVTESRQLAGAVPNDGVDLVTRSFYGVFGDLFCTKLPRGNGVEYTYDSARRLTAVTRGTAVASPDPATGACLDQAQPRERARYELDFAGHRKLEFRERCTQASCTVEATTKYEHSCHLDRLTQGEGSASPSITEYCYDQNDNLQDVWDANHHTGSAPPTQHYVYDELNRLKSVVVGQGTGTVATTSYTYDVQDHLASVTDAEGNPTTYTTSDRDLMTQQVSTVSGTTGYAYDPHGELLTTTDARAMVATRTVDAAGRPTQETFGPAGSPDPTLTTTHAYGATAGLFNIGRLTGITRNGHTVGYGYDRFGRLLQDGALGYQYDRNGYRIRIDYPGGVAAIQTPDFADRDAALSYDSGGGQQPLVTAAAYRAGGPLGSLTLANGLVETRSFDTRYFPSRIQAGSLLDWTYTVDFLGNPTGINGTIGSVAYGTTFGYQDNLYFLTQGDGPWGNRGWTYDRIGNRLSFTKAGDPTATYCYAGGACATAHNPKLQSVTPAPGWGSGSWSFTYDNAGSQTQLLESNDEGAVQTSFFDVAGDGRTSALRTSNGPTRTDLFYDGRGYLRQAQATVTPAGDFISVTPVYSSNGTLYARSEQRQWSGGTGGNGEDDSSFSQVSTDTTQLFYFAGRPVAQLTNEVELLYLTTDHLGTPVLATDSTGAKVWAGALEPFGAMWTATVDNPDTGGGFASLTRGEPSARGEKRGQPTGVLGTPGPAPTSKLLAEKVFLRYPGQWVSEVFRVTGTQQEVFYNVNRWFEPQTGRYTQPDPLWQKSAFPYSYVENKPTLYIDPLGLEKVKCKNCEDLERARRNTEKRIVLLHTTGSAMDPRAGASNVIGAETYCAASGTWGSAVTWRNPSDRFQDQPCIFLCTGVHERVHRHMCQTMGAAFMALTQPAAEIPAYAEERKCLKAAIGQGWLEVTTGGVGYPGSSLNP